MTFLQDLFSRRNQFKRGGVSYPANFVELYDGKMVESIPYEPDANTFRSNYYYNSFTNTLYKRIVTLNNKKAWKTISH